ncbi:MAG: DUF1841 family protein [Sulfuriflexus sp.]|nr:DUF1841 family protein [Sulfuriflexus sp.]
MFGQDRDQTRQVFINAWQKQQDNKPLEPLEEIIVTIISQHPEYQKQLTDTDKALGAEYLPENGETNPFLHMGMHIAIHEQLSTDRPSGIAGVFQQLVMQAGDAHHAEHQVMDCLGEMLWQAQRDQKMPDEQAYLGCLRKLLGKSK